ncbi:MAG: hypothetical protein IIV13_09845 [Bacteroidaceae bacterium]|nr:hypothetical protein [Bacteroidaceae bacterium]MBQ5644033.1 hypothetical protein [Bacteroidaceae bacterium]
MKKYLFMLFTFLVTTGAVHAQGSLELMANRLRDFGARVPQEQVFLHLDNTGYYLGDTLYYKAYVSRGDNGRPTNLSGILYCELLNDDGYLVERQMIALENGEGHGNFSLADTTLYAGYYELRAYTKWQLNWGVTEQPHSQWAEKYFFSKDMARDYYRDYEKLYSRVFPVFDRPLAPGDFSQDMTLRPLAAYYKNPADDPETTLQLFPEGGNLVAGLKQRVAWEVRNQQGRTLEGTLSVTTPDGQVIASETINRGRGIFEVTVPANQRLTAEFTPSASHDNPTGTLPATTMLKAEDDGVALRVDTDTAGISISCATAGLASQEELGITVMCKGILMHFQKIDAAPIHLPLSKAGVYQVTVFNQDGRVYADRLCFYLPSGFQSSNVTFSGVKTGNYSAFEPVAIELHGAPGASMSVAIRDAAKSEYVYDTGNMLTESLLSSQIKGFVPQPQWFFQKDEPQRRQALDLLLMVQGWRRYVWKEMAVQGEFQLLHMPESRYPHWTGQVHNYSAEQVLSVFEQRMQKEQDAGNDDSSSDKEQEEKDGEETMEEKVAANGNTGLTYSRDRFNKRENNLKYPVALHAEFSQPGNEGVEGDMRSQGSFALDFPRYYENFLFFLAASDTTKWKKGEPPVWVQNGRTKRDELEFPEFYVKLDPVYPRFPKPYDYYQSHLAPMPKDNPLYNSMNEQVRMLSEVTIGARRNGRRRFGHWRPAFIIDAYEAFNATCDAGFAPGYFMGAGRFGEDVARTFIGDMKTDRRYDVGYRFDGKVYSSGTAMQRRKTNTTKGTRMEPIPEDTYNMPDTKLDKYNYLWNLDKVVVFTDYSPRKDQSGKYRGNDLPSVTIDLHLLEADGERLYRKNRFWRMKGFSIPDEFYSPDYSKQPLPKEDYRRTLYWNPNVRLDSNGQATISLYNNSSSSILQISAEGWAPDGTPQCGNVN